MMFSPAEGDCSNTTNYTNRSGVDEQLQRIPVGPKNFPLKKRMQSRMLEAIPQQTDNDSKDLKETPTAVGAKETPPSPLSTKNVHNPDNPENRIQHDPYHDYASEIPPTGCYVSIPKSDRDVTFCMKLLFLLDSVEEDGYTHVISWQPHGRCFIVKDMDNIVNVLSMYLEITKWTSFQRQMYIYGFKRISRPGPDRGGYYHPKFLRGRAYLATQINRVTIKGTKVRQKTNPAQEPDFYSMPFVRPLEENKDEVLVIPARQQEETKRQMKRKMLFQNAGRKKSSKIVDRDVKQTDGAEQNNDSEVQIVVVPGSAQRIQIQNSCQNQGLGAPQGSSPQVQSAPQKSVASAQGPPDFTFAPLHATQHRQPLSKRMQTLNSSVTGACPSVQGATISSTSLMTGRHHMVRDGMDMVMARAPQLEFTGEFEENHPLERQRMGYVLAPSTGAARREPPQDQRLQASTAMRMTDNISFHQGTSFTQNITPASSSSADSSLAFQDLTGQTASGSAPQGFCFRALPENTPVLLVPPGHPLCSRLQNGGPTLVEVPTTTTEDGKMALVFGVSGPASLGNGSDRVVGQVQQGTVPFNDGSGGAVRLVWGGTAPVRGNESEHGRQQFTYPSMMSQIRRDFGQHAMYEPAPGLVPPLPHHQPPQYMAMSDDEPMQMQLPREARYTDSINMNNNSIDALLNEISAVRGEPTTSSPPLSRMGPAMSEHMLTGRYLNASMVRAIAAQGHTETVAGMERSTGRRPVLQSLPGAISREDQVRHFVTQDNQFCPHNPRQTAGTFMPVQSRASQPHSIRFTGPFVPEQKCITRAGQPAGTTEETLENTRKAKANELSSSQRSAACGRTNKNGIVLLSDTSTPRVRPDHGNEGDDDQITSKHQVIGALEGLMMLNTKKK